MAGYSDYGGGFGGDSGAGFYDDGAGGGVGGGMGGGATDGAGFMGGSQSMSQGSAGGKRTLQSQRTLIPATIRMLISATTSSGGEAGFMIDGKELHQFKLVGCIQQVDRTETSTALHIEDSTGRARIQIFGDGDDSTYVLEERKTWREGVYVAIVGQMKPFGDRVALNGHKVRVLKDHNEITHHIMDVIFAHLCNSADKLPWATGGAAAAAPVGGTSGGIGAPMGAAPSFGGDAFAADSGMAGDGGSLSKVQQLVLDTFRSNNDDSNEEGITLSTVSTILGPKGVNMQDVRAAVEFLALEGHVYSTVDDEHYKSTM